MRVYIVRHGEAGAAHSDSARQLTDAGRAEARAIAQFLKKTGARVSAIWHSPKARAKETAEILQREGDLGGDLTEHRGLLPEDHPSEVTIAIDAETEDLLIVGHLPNVSYLVSALLVDQHTRPFALFNTCSALCVERNGPSRWHLLWFISPELL